MKNKKKTYDKTYPCECTCASSCPIFDGIVYHSIGMDTVVCRCELADVSTTYSISWTSYHIAYTKRRKQEETKRNERKTDQFLEYSASWWSRTEQKNGMRFDSSLNQLRIPVGQSSHYHKPSN